MILRTGTVLLTWSYDLSVLWVTALVKMGRRLSAHQRLVKWDALPKFLYNQCNHNFFRNHCNHRNRGTITMEKPKQKLKTTIAVVESHPTDESAMIASTLVTTDIPMPEKTDIPIQETTEKLLKLSSKTCTLAVADPHPTDENSMIACAVATTDLRHKQSKVETTDKSPELSKTCTEACTISSECKTCTKTCKISSELKSPVAPTPTTPTPTPEGTAVQVESTATETSATISSPPLEKESPLEQLYNWFDIPQEDRTLLTKELLIHSFEHLLERRKEIERFTGPLRKETRHWLTVVIEAVFLQKNIGLEPTGNIMRHVLYCLALRKLGEGSHVPSETKSVLKKPSNANCLVDLSDSEGEDEDSIRSKSVPSASTESVVLLHSEKGLDIDIPISAYNFLDLEYQREGVKWMLKLHEDGIGGLLAE